MLRRLAIAAVVVALGVGGLALAASGREQRAATPVAAKKKQAQSKLPPLPDMRPKVVEPVAGNGGAAAPALAVPGITEVGPKPKGPASAGAVQRGATVTADVTKARALGNGVALPPLEAPDAVRQIIEAGNAIARTPYLWGGGHGKWLDKGYDCSGSVSFVLASAGLLGGPLDSGHLMSWGQPGKGRWVTIYANAGHVFLEVAGVRFDTGAQSVTGSRWASDGRSTAGFVARHPAGL